VQGVCEEGFEEGVEVRWGEGVNGYVVMKFHGGPWDGSELQQEFMPPRMQVRVSSKDRENRNGDLWTYEPGVREGVVVHMDGRLEPPVKV
jgi:hypothetical protein